MSEFLVLCLCYWPLINVNVTLPPTGPQAMHYLKLSHIITIREALIYNQMLVHAQSDTRLRKTGTIYVCIAIIQ